MLREIAPTLAKARDQRAWTTITEPDIGPVGQEWCTIRYWNTSTGKCDCGGVTDVTNFSREITHGCNEGHITHDRVEKCRDCRRSLARLG